MRDFVITNRLAALQAAEALKGELESMTVEYNRKVEEKRIQEEADEKERQERRELKMAYQKEAEKKVEEEAEKQLKQEGKIL